MGINWRQAKASAQKALNAIDTENLNRSSYVLLGSLLTIINHGESEPLTIETDYVPTSLIDERKQESLSHFIHYMNEKSLEQTTGASLHGEYAEKALKQMLAVDEEIAIMLYNSADVAERRLIAESYQKILSKVKV